MHAAELFGSALGNSSSEGRAGAAEQDGLRKKLKNKTAVTKASVDPTVSSGA